MQTDDHPWKPGTIVQVRRDRYGYKIGPDRFYARRVTTLLQGIPKPALTQWAANRVAQFAVDNREAIASLPPRDALAMLKSAPTRDRDDAAERGTGVHAAIEAYLNDAPLPDGLSEDQLLCAIGAEAFLRENVRKILGVEMVVFHPDLGYAGTVDLFFEDHDGKRWLVDWKSSKGVYAEHAVQLTAYSHAPIALIRQLGEGTADDFPAKVARLGPAKVDRMAIVHVEPKGATVHEIVLSPRLWKVFRAAAEIKRWQLDTDAYNRSPRERVFLAPIPVGEHTREEKA